MRDVTSALPRIKLGIFNPQKSCKTCLAIEHCGISTHPRLDLDLDPTPPDSTHSRPQYGPDPSPTRPIPRPDPTQLDTESTLPLSRPVPDSTRNPIRPHITAATSLACALTNAFSLYFFWDSGLWPKVLAISSPCALSCQTGRGILSTPALDFRNRTQRWTKHRQISVTHYCQLDVKLREG